MANSSRFLDVAVEAAKAGGKILMARYGRLEKKDIAKKGRSDWVTTIDHAAERVILTVIHENFPEHSVKAEESAPKAPRASYQWFVDPLDGTINYIHQFPSFAVSVALAHEGKLQVGVVYDPLREELFTASAGTGAWLNGKRIRVTAVSKLEESLLATGFPLRAQEKLPIYLESFRQIFSRIGSIRRAGSAAIDLAYTACGRVDGFWEMALSAWDIAGGVLLIQEAGGKVSDFFGGDTYLESGHITAGNAAIHRELVKILTPIFRGHV